MLSKRFVVENTFAFGIEPKMRRQEVGLGAERAVFGRRQLGDGEHLGIADVRHIEALLLDGEAARRR